MSVESSPSQIQERRTKVCCFLTSSRRAMVWFTLGGTSIMMDGALTGPLIRPEPAEKAIWPR